MKKLLAAAVSILLIFALVPFLPTVSDLSLYENVIRLHILANSNTAEDQALKLYVRDRILEHIDSLVIDAKNKSEAEENIISSLDEIKDAAKEAVSDYGSDESVSVSLSNEEYPRRQYGFVTLPAGNYTSLRIMIGNAEGANWWCVLFPRLCTAPALKNEDPSENADIKEEFIEAGFTPSQYKLITESENKKYIIKFRIVELFKELFG